MVLVLSARCWKTTDKDYKLWGFFDMIEERDKRIG